jgi:hypothetical protein
MMSEAYVTSGRQAMAGSIAATVSSDAFRVSMRQP